MTGLRDEIAGERDDLVNTAGTVPVSIALNGVERRVRVDSRARLLDVLRDVFELSSVRDGCSVGMCGACTVLVDGSAVSSCLTLAALCDGRQVRTAESFDADGRSDPIVRAFVEGRAFQCSYCTPGFVVALRGLLEAGPSPSRSQIETCLSGHLCRCGSYSRILDAAVRAVDRAALDGGVAPQWSASPELHTPERLDEAIGLLAAGGGDALAVAGATAVTLLLHHRLVWPTALVSLRRVPGLDRIELVGDTLRLGALVTHARVAADPLVAARLPVLAETFAVVANHRVRAAATVGGVLAEADHASDPPAAFRALDARAVVAGPEGERRVEVGDLLTGHYETSLVPGEVIVAVEVPLPPEGSVATYVKFRSTASEDRPCVGVAVLLRAGPDGVCEELRVCVGAASEVPLRLAETEAAAAGRHVDAALAGEVAEDYAAALRPVADVRGSAWYRREVTRVVVERAVLKSASGETSRP